MPKIKLEEHKNKYIKVNEIIHTLEDHIQNVLDTDCLSGIYSMDMTLIADILYTIESKAQNYEDIDEI